MDRLITLLCTMLLSAAIAGGGVWAWDRHAPISIPFLFWHITAPPSIAMERDAALSASRMAQDDLNRCNVSLRAQNASIAQAAKLGAAATAQAQAELDATRGENARLRAAQTRLAAFRLTPGETMGQNWQRADDAVIAALKEVR